MRDQCFWTVANIDALIIFSIIFAFVTSVIFFIVSVIKYSKYRNIYDKKGFLHNFFVLVILPMIFGLLSGTFYGLFEYAQYNFGDKHKEYYRGFFYYHQVPLSEESYLFFDVDVEIPVVACIECGNSCNFKNLCVRKFIRRDNLLISIRDNLVTSYNLNTNIKKEYNYDDAVDILNIQEKEIFTPIGYYNFYWKDNNKSIFFDYSSQTIVILWIILFAAISYKIAIPKIEANSA